MLLFYKISVRIKYHAKDDMPFNKEIKSNQIIISNPVFEAFH